MGFVSNLVSTILEVRKNLTGRVGANGHEQLIGQTINVGDEIKVTKRNQERHVSGNLYFYTFKLRSTCD